MSAALEMIEREIHEVYIKHLGRWPLLLKSARDSGDLEEVWPMIKQVYFNPVPLPSLVVNALMALMGLRCKENYCFVIHSMYLVNEGVDPDAITDLGRFFTIPIDDSPRWTRIVGLAWLSNGDDAEAKLADFALRKRVTSDEYKKLKDVMELAKRMMAYIKRDDILLEDEPTLSMIPEHARSFMPRFVAFHADLKGIDGGEKAVVTTCAWCKKIRSSSDNQWYPRDVVLASLKGDVLYSHGLCEPCAEELSEDMDMSA